MSAGVATAAVATEAPMLAARELVVRLGGATIVDGAEVEVRPGELVALVGPNGAGKSTFVRAAAGLLKPASGEALCMGRPVRELRMRELARMRAFVPQRPQVPAGVTVREAVTIGRSAQLRALGRPTRVDREAVDAALARAGVERFAARQLTTLSGGELQRVQIAVALAQQAPLLIADEPTAHLDLGAAAGVARLLRGLAEGGLGVLLVVHDLALAAAVADRVVVMSAGRTVATGRPAEVLQPGLLREVWGVEASLDADGGDATALRVAWLTEQEEAR